MPQPRRPFIQFQKIQHMHFEIRLMYSIANKSHFEGTLFWNAATELSEIECWGRGRGVWSGMTNWHSGILLINLKPSAENSDSKWWLLSCVITVIPGAHSAATIKRLLGLTAALPSEDRSRTAAAEGRNSWALEEGVVLVGGGGWWFEGGVFLRRLRLHFSPELCSSSKAPEKPGRWVAFAPPVLH